MQNKVDFFITTISNWTLCFASAAKWSYTGTVLHWLHYSIAASAVAALMTFILDTFVNYCTVWDFHAINITF